MQGRSKIFIAKPKRRGEERRRRRRRRRRGGDSGGKSLAERDGIRFLPLKDILKMTQKHF